MKKYKIDTDSGSFFVFVILVLALIAVAVISAIALLLSRLIGLWAVVAVPLLLVVVAFISSLRVVKPENKE